MSYISGPEVPIDSLRELQIPAFGLHPLLDQVAQLIQCRPLSICNIVDLIHGPRIVCGRGQDIGLDAVFNIAKVPGCFAVSVDIESLSQRRICNDDSVIGAKKMSKAGRYGCIAQIGVL